MKYVLLLIVSLVAVDNFAGTAHTTPEGKQERIAQWLYLENHRNGIQPRASNPLALYSEFPAKYRPGAKPYDLPVYLVDRAACLIFTSRHPNPILLEKYLPAGEKIPYPVHPVNIGDRRVPHIDEITKQFIKNVQVQATSSTRTVFVADPDVRYCLKPHTNLTITKWRRHMEARKVKHAVGITKILEQSNTFKTNPKIAFYPESIGVVYGEGEREDWGYIIREMDSQPVMDRPYQMIPFCSLYMSDGQKKEDPILVRMIKKSGKDPFRVISDEVLLPMLEGWIQVYMETGVLFEPHGQNVIVEADEISGEIIRFAHRDFDCVINKDIAEKNGYGTDDLNSSDIFTTEGSEHTPQGSLVSSIFDNSVLVPLEAMADLGETYFNIEKEHLRAYCRKVLTSKYPEFFDKYLPPKGTSYKWEKNEQGDKFLIKVSKSSPWR